ncbi:2-hydroxyacid dehydrogenase [Daejeonella oryzae]|uniref:2-hydroxyacid dehydrogenase n=1 Tax=Daejeonella oryzae TaxID=1122943 RepID=UPI0004201100|nr:2-hydroxyacid dehydrogenase [Daejeonella oryzae]
MKAVAYSIKTCEKEILIKANKKKHDITLISNRLTIDTASYSAGKDAVIVFSSDDLSAPVIQKLKELGVKYISIRSTGTDNIDLAEASRLGIKVANIPAYSPQSIAEHAITLILSLSRNIIPAHQQMLEYDFSLDNLVGTTIGNKTIGIIGCGESGRSLARILRGFGSRVIVFEPQDVKQQCDELGAEQVSYNELLSQSDIISLHLPLNDQTRHMINSESISKMKDGVMLINVSRGALFNSEDVLTALQNDKISKIGMDVYEFEHEYFFFDHSHKPISDLMLKAFIQNSRVLITPHQAFLTKEALQVIAEKTIENLDNWKEDKNTEMLASA